MYLRVLVFALTRLKTKYARWGLKKWSWVALYGGREARFHCIAENG